jgi:hypothetical protein
MIRAALALTLLASCAAAAPTPTITRDLGGVAPDYMMAVDRMIASGQTARITGTCASACVVYAAVACTVPSARWGFHSASTNGDPNSIGAKLANMRMAGYLPRSMQGDFKNIWSKSLAITWKSGADMIAAGVKECK